MAGTEITARGSGAGSTVHHWMLELGKGISRFLTNCGLGKHR